MTKAPLGKMVTTREEFLMKEIEKRDRIIRSLSHARHSKPQPLLGNQSQQGRLMLARFPLTEWAMAEGQCMPLPQTLDDIADVIGREGALMLAEAYLSRQTGNRSWRAQIYIPQRALDDAHPLVQILGRQRAEQLQETHTNMIIEIPRCAEIQRAYRDHVATVMLQAGQTPEEIAACGAVTVQRAREIDQRGLE